MDEVRPEIRDATRTRDKVQNGRRGNSWITVFILHTFNYCTLILQRIIQLVFVFLENG